MVVRFNLKNGGLTKPSLSPVTHTLANNLLMQAFSSLGMLISARLELQHLYANNQVSSQFDAVCKTVHISLHFLYQPCIKDRWTEPQPPIPNCTATHPQDKTEPQPTLPNSTAAKAQVTTAYQIVRRQRLILKLHTKLYVGNVLGCKLHTKLTMAKA